MSRWTLDEDIKLLTLVREHFASLAGQRRLDADTPFSQRLYAEFNSPERSADALLYRLYTAKILAFDGPPTQPERQRFRCLLEDDLALYDYRITLPTLKQSLHPATVKAVLNHLDQSDKHKPVVDVIDTAATTVELAPMQVEKVLVENGRLIVNRYRALERVKPAGDDFAGLREFIAQQAPDGKLVGRINACRARASRLYHVHEHDGAEVVFSYDGTGFGKSFGVVQSFVDYIERQAKAGRLQSELVESSFTNFLFLSPQKSQIDLERCQIDKIRKAGGEFICVLSRQDVADLDFVDWTTGLTNRERYRSWYQGAKTSGYIGTDMRRLNDWINQIDRCQIQIDRLTGVGGVEAMEERQMVEEQLESCRHGLRRTLEAACKALFNGDAQDQAGLEACLREHVSRGIRARRERVRKSATALRTHEVYLELIKQVLPFEVCRYRPSVLLMTTNKFDTSTFRLAPCRRGEGVRLVSTGFDLLVGGKLRPEEPRISTLSGAPHAAQVDYLRDEHFPLNLDCPFRRRDIRFTVVIDELHEAYARLEQSCHVPLVTQKNNLAHVLSVVGRIHSAVLSLEHRSVPEAEQESFQREQARFIRVIRELLADKCELSAGTTLGSMLGMFRDQLGAFEVNGDAAERIISITRNVFSFNAKMYVNEEALKRIRMRHSDGDTTRTELYYEREGDSADANPTLHDLFQLVSAILAACAGITNRHFKRWIKSGGQLDASSQNAPLGQFVDAANAVAGEVRHIFDRATDEQLKIDHFHTYLQPKTVFTMAPVAELDYVNRGAERTIILAFRMDLIKELPEAMVLRLLAGTHNKVVGLSATGGQRHTKNGSFSQRFLKRYAEGLGYRVVERGGDDVPTLQELRKLRARLRQVSFHPFSAEREEMTDTRERDPVFKAVYDDMRNALKEPLAYAWRNPYKRRQHLRELEALLLAAYEGKNSLILSLSGRFKDAFARAYREHRQAWRHRYAMSSECDGRGDGRHDQILTFTPFAGRHTVHLVFFNAALARTVNVKEYTRLGNARSVLVLMSTYKSAGTGLNYFVRYQRDGVSREQAAEAPMLDELALDVDFQRLVLINSPFYSEVMDKSPSLNTLPNYVSLLKHLADDVAEHTMAEFNVNFAQGDNYRLLMAEHNASLFKVLMQAVGRVERRDTHLESEIFLPDDVLHNAAFQFAGLSEDPESETVLECMSLLNHRLKAFGERRGEDSSFTTSKERHDFEESVLTHGRRIDAVHKRVLKADWINRVRSGDMAFLELCNLFRDSDSFSDPERWLAGLQAHPLYAANRHMQSIHETLFIPRWQNGWHIMLCHRRGPDGLPHRDYAALSDFTGGAREYRPERSIFPQYNQDVDVSQGNLVGRLINDCAGLQQNVFMEQLPHPMLVPLLKGNVGEYLFDRVLAAYGVRPLDDQQVFERLGPQVYEFFDRFIEVGDDLICVDVKRWATRLDNISQAESTLEKSQGKMRQMRRLARQVAEPEGQARVRAAPAGRYRALRFVYLNAAYSQNPNNLMGEESADHSVHYLNLFQSRHAYYQPMDRERLRYQEKSRLSTVLHINPLLDALVGR